MELRFTSQMKTWLITKNYDTLIYNGKNYDIIPKQSKFIALEL